MAIGTGTGFVNFQTGRSFLLTMKVDCDDLWAGASAASKFNTVACTSTRDRFVYAGRDYLSIGSTLFYMQPRPLKKALHWLRENGIEVRD